MEFKSKKPLGIFDTTLRDGHQSLLATRMRLEDIIPLAERLDEVGFAAMEVWGGATFDVTHRFLNEDPWERLETIKKYCKKTPLSMLLRGQNLVGYRNYADDVVEAFVMQAAESGIDQFRVFDALNDERNFEAAVKAIKKTGKHFQGTICYSLTERRLGGPIYNIEYFEKKARILEDMGANSLCIKDMAGICSPYDAYDLIRALKKVVKIPIQLHTHYTSGMGSMTYLKAAEAGVDVVDTALAPFALRSSQPAVEPIVVALEGTPRDTGLNLKLLLEIGNDLEKIAPKYRDFLDQTKMAVIDTNVLSHQVPGGMLSNMVNQLKEAGALDRIREVYNELPRTRKDLGSPPLVTPSSQIVGIQAVQNVLFGRYKMITKEVRDLCYGLYGRTPVPIDADVQKNCLKGYERGETPITGRAADVLKPEMEKAKEATKDLAKNIKDVLIYALYPTTGERYLKWKYGVEPVPASMKARTLEDISRENEMISKLKAGKLIEKPEKAAPEKSEDIRSFNVFVDGDYFKVEVEEPGGRPVVRQVRPQAAAKSEAKASSQPAAAGEKTPAKAAGNAPVISSAAACDVAAGEIAIESPMAGMILDVKVNVGAEVKQDQVLILIEAMKMENEIRSRASGKVKKLLCKKGDHVEKNQVLAVLG